MSHRTLADADNRGKLNLAEFHVAMGLIYRRTLYNHPLTVFAQYMRICRPQWQ
jgi:hypothetical protein